MHIQDIFKSDSLTVSFEFFPPRTEASANSLLGTIREIEALKPSFVTVTYGAGGSTRELTHELVERIQKETSLTAAAHLTVIGHKESELRGILGRYIKNGIQNIMALGGDPPRSNPSYDRSQDSFRYAEDLVRYVRSFSNVPDSRGFGLGVAGYPEGHPATPNRLKEMEYLKRKVDAGADYLCTQLFFDNHEFYEFCERCELSGIRIPILAGIMPLTSAANMNRMAELSALTRFPARLLKAVSRCNNDSDIARVGVDWATEQCAELIKNGVRGIHFYTLNRSDATKEVYNRLNFRSIRHNG